MIMKIAIISDTHDNLATLKIFLKFAKENKIQTLIHCGDVATGETLSYIAAEFGNSIYVAEGNMDFGHELEITAKKLPNVSYFKGFGQTEINGLQIGFCHFKETALHHCQTEKFDFVFYGHTHKPWEENINHCCLANPGNLAGQFYKATFAVLDVGTKQLDLKILELLQKPV